MLAPRKSAKSASRGVRTAPDDDDGNQLISVRLAPPPKAGCFGSKNYTANGVGMRHYTETLWTRFSAHAGRLHARLHQR